MDIYSSFATRFEKTREDELSLEEYLALCNEEPDTYATAGERLLKAIGEPVQIDTRNDPRLSRIFANKVVKVYRAFPEFYGMDNVIEQVLAYFRQSAQGPEEKKQILYLLGPAGSCRAMVARLMQLIERTPFYAIKGSPVNESPLGLFDYEEDGPTLEEQYGIPRHDLKRALSPWAIKRLDEYDGDIGKFRVVRRYPSIRRHIGIAKTGPVAENNQDISALVGKVDIRKLKKFAVDDADAYSYSGGLCLANQGLLEFVEMFKAPIKILHPLLTATQEGNFKGTEGFGAIPFDGVIVAHSNEQEWNAFRNDHKNEALLKQLFVVKLPRCRDREQVRIYERLLRNSSPRTHLRLRTAQRNLKKSTWRREFFFDLTATVAKRTLLGLAIWLVTHGIGEPARHQSQHEYRCVSAGQPITWMRNQS